MLKILFALRGCSCSVSENIPSGTSWGCALCNFDMNWQKRKEGRTSFKIAPFLQYTKWRKLTFGPQALWECSFPHAAVQRNDMIKSVNGRFKKGMCKCLFRKKLNWLIQAPHTIFCLAGTNCTETELFTDIQPAAQRTVKGKVCNTTAWKMLESFSQKEISWVKP